MKPNEWINLKVLTSTIPETKWPKFRKLRLPARLISDKNVYEIDFASNKINFLKDDLRIGSVDSYSVVIVPVKAPQCWIHYDINKVEIFVSEENLAKLGCIILSAE